MDPKSTLIELLSALLERDTYTANEHFEYLVEWLDKGGYIPPEIGGLIESLQQ